MEIALKTVVHISTKLYYTDSKVTLSWVKSVDKEFENFAENPLKEILKLSNYNDWNFIKTSQNPADVLTRKQTFEKFKENILYGEGSSFLKNNVFRGGSRDFKKGGRSMSATMVGRQKRFRFQMV